MAPLGAALAGPLLAGRYGQVVAVLQYLMLGFAAVGVAARPAHPNWRRGLLSERAGRARRFDASLAASIGLALVVSVATIPAIGMLVAANRMPGRECRADAGVLSGREHFLAPGTAGVIARDRVHDH